MIRHLALVGSLAVMAISLGCSGQNAGGNRKTVYPVTGKVTLAGGPVAGATVMFSPMEGQPVATAISDAEGNYRLTTYEAADGAAAGSFKVLVTKEVASAAPPGPVAHDAARPGAGAAMHAAAKANKGKDGAGLPEKYSRMDQSDLLVKVEDKPNTIDLALKP